MEHLVEPSSKASGVPRLERDAIDDARSELDARHLDRAAWRLRSGRVLW
jgi:hypothetical protein